MPPIDEEISIVLFDVPPKKSSDWDITKGPGGLNYEDTHASDEMCTISPILITYQGNDYVPVKYPSGMKYIEPRFLKPLKPYSDAGYMDIFARTTDGMTYFIVKSGFYLKAVIHPSTPPQEMFEHVDVR